MHSHDRTMLAKLGFADPDKKNPDHDAACMYLKQDAVLLRVVEHVAATIFARAYGKGVHLATGSEHSIVHKQMEYHLQKGEGKYATTVGFVDVFAVSSCCAASVEGRRLHEVVQEERLMRSKKSIEEWDGSRRFKNQLTDIEFERVYGPRPQEYQKKDYGGRVVTFDWFIEVKIEPIPIGDILRQMNLYTSYLSPDRADGKRGGIPPIGVVVTAWDLDDTEEETLREAGYAHFTLGDGFREWDERRRSQKPNNAGL